MNNIYFTKHALLKMQERGASEDEVISAIMNGKREMAQRGFYSFRSNFEFHNIWAGKYYSVKQVMPIVSVEEEKMVVITVYSYYFQEGEQR